MGSNLQLSGSLFKDLKNTWKPDMISGFLVFLIALPLSLGISKASGFPAIAGIYTAIIGGLLVSFFSGSQLTIKGAAAGLIVIALGAVEELGHGDPERGYKLTLAVIVISGVIQILMGVFRSGFLADFMPVSAIHGMLASIGIIIISKQIHIAMGVKPIGKEPIELIEEIPNSLLHMNPELALIGVLGILILFLLPKWNNRYAKMVPGPLIVLIMAIPLGLLFELNKEHNYTFFTVFHVDPKDVLIKLPDSFLDGITFPDFSEIYSFTSIKYIIMFALVGSIESMLSAKAIDSLDPYKRKSNLNKDLLAVGIGNTLAGFIGGLPMICEVVRSSANINNGGKTAWSNFFHGLFMILAVVFAAGLLQQIPNAALAAMLIYTGFKLASPNEFKKTFKIGPDQLVIFLTTMIITLSTDLLVGIFAGIFIKLLQHRFFGATFKSLFKMNVRLESKDELNHILHIKDSAVFTNFLPFKKEVEKFPKNSHVVVDLHDATLVDHTFMEHLHEFEVDFANNGGSFEWVNYDALTPYSNHPLSSRKFMNDAIFAPTKIIYNEHQKELITLAEKRNLVFDHKRTTSIIKFRFAPFAISRKADYGQNLLMASGPYYNYFTADIRVNESVGMTSRSYLLTIMLVTDIKRIIPEFRLEKTGVLDVLKNIGGSRDINFDEYPVFSKEYFLEGKDEQLVREFFNEKLIRFFEKNKDFYVESKNNILLVNNGDHVWSSNEIESAFDKLKEFMDIIMEDYIATSHLPTDNPLAKSLIEGSKKKK